MFEKKLALHETLEFHEVINFKTVCLLKSKMMQGIVFDQDLKALMEKDVKTIYTSFNSNDKTIFKC